jgi:hypothetical protein
MKRALAVLVIALPAFAQFSSRPADAIVPVVGSTAGQGNGQFRTELQLANRGTTASAGWLMLRPSGLIRRFEIPAHGTLSFADVVAEMGGSGLGSLDVLIDRGALPVIVARAYDDQPTGTTGVSVPAVPLGDVLSRNDVAILIVPRDLVRYRFNIGVRAMDEGATLELIVRNAAGTARGFRSVPFAKNAFVQQSANALVGLTLEANDSIEVKVAAGSAVVYATTVDNATNDSSLQLLRK